MALRLMCITAHPDDESGAFAGALMQAHARGVETSVVCLTDGRAASHRGETRTDDELGALRRQEFAAAIHMLHVDHGEVLGYPDGALSRYDFLEITTALVERIRRFRPQVVLTFGGDGGVNLHPDHSMTSCFATAAFHWSGHSTFAPQQAHDRLAPYRPQKLYYSATSFVVRESPASAATIPLVPSSLALELGDLKDRKLEAFLQHKSQAAIVTQVRESFEEHGRQERYLLVAARGVCSLSLEDDMFAGIEDE